MSILYIIRQSKLVMVIKLCLLEKFQKRLDTFVIQTWQITNFDRKPSYILRTSSSVGNTKRLHLCRVILMGTKMLLSLYKNIGNKSWATTHPLGRRNFSEWIVLRWLLV